MNFVDDELEVCDVCNEPIVPGDYYFEFRSWKCCCEDCVKEKMLELMGDEVQEKYLQTAADKEMEYGDMKFDEEREERLLNG